MISFCSWVFIFIFPSMWPPHAAVSWSKKSKAAPAAPCNQSHGEPLDGDACLGHRATGARSGLFGNSINGHTHAVFVLTASKLSSFGQIHSGLPRSEAGVICLLLSNVAARLSAVADRVTVNRGHCFFLGPCG